MNEEDIDEDVPPLERFNRASFWFDYMRLVDRDAPFLTNLAMDVELLLLMGIPGKSILFVTDSADEALTSLEKMEELTTEGVRVIAGDPFEVAKDYRRKLGAFFYSRDAQPSAELHEKLLNVAMNGRDRMVIGTRFLPGPLPEELRKNVDQMVLAEKGLIMKGGAAPRKDGVTYFPPVDQASIDFMMSLSCRAYMMGNNGLYFPLRMFVKGLEETSRTGRILRHTVGGMVIRRMVGESQKSFMKRYMDLGNFVEVASGGGWEHINQELKKLMADMVDMPNRRTPLEQIIDQFSLIYGVDKDVLMKFANEYKLRRLR